jgi:hypothetical protein
LCQSGDELSAGQDFGTDSLAQEAGNLTGLRMPPQNGLGKD